MVSASSNPHVLRDEQRISAFVGLLLVFFFLSLSFFKGAALLGDPDTGWHIATGEWIWTHGALPQTDPFSHTFAGEPWFAKEWLSQLLYYAGYALAGWNGVVILAAVAIAAGAGALYWVLSRDLSPVHAAFVCVLAVMLASGSFVARPHLLTLPLLVLWTDGVFRAAAKGAAPRVGWLFLFVLWANLHGAFTLGLLIAFFAFADFLEKGGAGRQAAKRRWLVFLALCLLATLVHPYGWKSLFATWTVYGSNEAMSMITEWQPFNAPTDRVHEIALICLFSAAIASGFRLGIARACLLALLLHLFLNHARSAFYLFPVMAVLIAPALARQFPRLSAQAWLTRGRDETERWVVGAFRPLTVVAVCGFAGLAASQFWFLRVLPPPSLAAPGAIAFAASNDMPGNVFNRYDIGGMLILNGIKTFIDGRNDQLFRGGFTSRFMSGPLTETALSDAFRQFDIGWTLLRPGDSRVALIDSMPGWRQVYADQFAVIHVRQN